MMMYFHFSLKEYILFETLQTTTAGGMVGACIVIFFMTIFYEGLKAFREWLVSYLSQNKVEDTDGSKTTEEEPRSVRSMILNVSHVVQSIMHVVQFVISYFLMLIFMTYNLWLCFAVSLGAGVGYFLFGWYHGKGQIGRSNRNEHCH